MPCYANAKTVTESFVRVYSLVALQCGPAPNRYTGVTRPQLIRCGMSWRQQASRPIQCRSCPASVPLRGVLRPRRLRERIRHAGDFWCPNTCLMTGVGAGRAGFVAQTSRQRCASHIVCSRLFVGCHRMRTCVHCKPRNHGPAHNSAADEPASRRTFGQRIHTSMQNSSLAPRRRTRHLPINIHRRPLAEGRLGRKGAWGGRSMGRKGAWGGREAGADGSMGRNGVWGGREYGGKRSMGRKGVWGARHIPTHHPPLAPSSYDISQPAGRHLPYTGGGHSN